MVVSAIVDTLKTAFPRSEPQSPTEELSEAETESKSQTEGKKAGKWEALSHPGTFPQFPDWSPILSQHSPYSQALEERRWVRHTTF